VAERDVAPFEADLGRRIDAAVDEHGNISGVCQSPQSGPQFDPGPCDGKGGVPQLAELRSCSRSGRIRPDRFGEDASREQTRTGDDGSSNKERFGERPWDERVSVRRDADDGHVV
jgi:hypothetical protein